MDQWLRDNLVCPIHRTRVTEQSTRLACEYGCGFPIVSGVPCMLIKGICNDALLHGQQDEQRINMRRTSLDNPEIDPWVQENIFSSNSHLYASLAGKLNRYPIPSLPLSHCSSRRSYFLDIGCNWGRWSLSARLNGFEPIGIDPWLPSVLAAKRVSDQLGLPAKYIVADARYLPFRSGTFDVVFSYSTLQHLTKPDVELVMARVRDVLVPGGLSQLHLLNKFGLRSMQTQLARRFREPSGIEARFWSPAKMLDAGERQIGPSRIAIDGFFSQGRTTDTDLLPRRYRAVIQISEKLKTLSRHLPVVGKVADQLFLTSVKTLVRHRERLQPEETDSAEMVCEISTIA